MRRVASVMFIFFALATSGCSYSTDFAIVNESGAPVHLTYRFKAYPGKFEPAIPATVPLSEMGSKSNDWTKIDSSEYQVDEHNHSISLILKSGQAIRVASLHNYTGHDDRKKDFPIEELLIVGTHGQSQFTGDQVRRNFEKLSANLYTLGYK
ncbi:MAG TPA: hypothetical protein VF074_10930 [Pyrinomonadaceae bacterium]